MAGEPLPEGRAGSWRTAPTRSRPAGTASRLEAFERVYRGEFGAVAAYFARRCRDPRIVAGLTADTFVAAIHCFERFDPARQSARAWTIGLARGVYAAHRRSDPRGSDPLPAGALHRMLDRGEERELLWWIDVERSSRELLERVALMPELDRDCVELVDLCGLTPEEAARELCLSVTSLRVRLLRTRGRLRREARDG